MMRKLSVTLAAAALVLGLQSIAWAAVPAVIPYQGRLTDASGTVISGSQSIVFSLFTVATGGTAVWTETQPTVAVAAGLFSVDLGSVTTLPPSVFTGGDLYLEIKVGTDAAMTPRQRLGTVAYAQRAGLAASVGSSFKAWALTTQAVGIQDLTTYVATFPGPGYAIVQGYVQLGWSGAATGEYNLNITQASLSSPFNTGTTFEYHSGDAAGSTHRGMLSNMRVFSIPGAGARTFYLVGEAQASSYEVWGAHLIVQFVPDALGTVVAPLEVPASALKPDSGTSAETSAGSK